MGWHDRQYDDHYTEERFSMGVQRPPTGALTLMIIHGVAWVVMAMLSADAAEEAGSLQQLLHPAVSPLGILLHPFATTRVLSMLFVVLALWSLGGRIENRLGTRRLVGLYVAGNVTAGTVFFALGLAAPQLAVAPLDYPVGALAALVGVAWNHLRDDIVNVFGKMVSIAKVYAITAAVIVAIEIIRGGIGAATWLVATATGGMVGLWGYELWQRSARPRRRVVRPSIPRRPRPIADSPEIDDILAKISASGLDSLTDDERQRLEDARRRKLEQF